MNCALRVASALVLFGVALSLNACKRSTEDEPSKSAEPTPKIPTAESPQPKLSEPTVVASSKETTGEAPRKFSELEQILGSKADGWSPKAIAAFQEGMTPEEAEKVMTGAGKISQYGISKVKGTGVPLVVKYEFHFLSRQKDGPRDRLYSVTIHFDPVLNDDKEFYDALVRATTAKYGSVKPQDVEKKLLTWIGPDFASAQLSKLPGEWDGYHLKVTPTKE